MPSAHNKKAKTININLTETEYEKVKQLAEIRHLNPTSYTRLVALGNRIKPTVITYSEQEERSNTSENDFGEEIYQLEEKIKHLEQENEIFHYLLQHFDSTAFFNFHTYRKDQQLKNAIKHLKEKI